MTRKPKIRPRLMWGVVTRRGIICEVHPTLWEANLKQPGSVGFVIQRVLVCAVPKRRKRHAKR